MSIDNMGIIRQLQKRLQDQHNLEQHQPVHGKNSLVGADKLGKARDIYPESIFKRGKADNDSQEFRNAERRQLTSELSKKVGGARQGSDNMLSKFAKYLRGQGFDENLNTKQLEQLLQHIAPLEIQPKPIEKFGTGRRKKKGGKCSASDCFAQQRGADPIPECEDYCQQHDEDYYHNEMEQGKGRRRGKALPFPGDIYGKGMPSGAKHGLTLYKAYIDSLPKHLTRLEKNILWKQNKMQTMNPSNPSNY